MPYSLKEISVLFRGSVSTLKRRIRELKKNGKFEKKSAGKFYDFKELTELSTLLNFQIKQDKKLETKIKNINENKYKSIFTVTSPNYYNSTNDPNRTKQIKRRGNR